MKHLLSSIITAILFSVTTFAQDGSDFFSGTSLSAQTVNTKAAIASIDGIAKKNAAKTITLTAENAKESFNEAKNYKFGVIVVGEHTAVKIADFKNCHQSGSWGTCMPHGEGYIKKGTLTPMKDYVNNIIGRPDTQVRTLYLFN